MFHVFRFRAAGVIVVEDFPAEVVNRQRRLIPVLHAAHKNPQKFKARLLIDKLLLNNKLYSTDDLDDIPEELRPCNLSTVQNNHMVAFFTRDSKFSNHFPCLFEHDGLQFSSVEQFLMFQKAKHFGDDSIAKEIMKTNDPAITKALGRKVKHFKLEDWKKVCDEYMRNGIRAKFTQNPSHASALKDTQKKTLIEANPKDTYWGCGLSLSDNNKWTPAKWKGLNMLGKMLTELRDSL